jgi:ParB family chromosome partitioning protein
VQRLGWLHVEVIVRREMRDVDDLVAALVENGQRAGLDPIEEARALNALKVRDGLSDFELGKKVGRSQGTVSGRIALLALSPAEQEELRAGHMRIVEATHTARMNSGKVRPTGIGRGWHLNPSHPLAGRAKARCERAGHKPGRGVGGVAACGSCWEEVIRADERQSIHSAAAVAHECPICNGPYGGGES